ncbi:unnamed protein product [Didymodactylos carnosus]|uniref:SH3 domain-containing protein n=1 Tax=Didymodactylos carnosus TaxID=1234261 RepID=A0A814KR78_9BILA|nr:unnamed protein product [Didymodactylos carnosus]CAF1054449.1 unnamed protein product [Didymodactylos carnosus]CAF3494468.1 unnamed protein product [Didymodactylos carnosus]CAF3823560.1 unnamed protein product [Didymodactylos carnosus]
MSESKVHVELTTAYTENKQKVVTLNIYNMKKLKQLLHTFSLHQAQQWIFALTGVISEPDQGSEYVICTPTMPSTHIPPPKLIPIPPQGRTKTVLYEPTSSDRLVNTIDFQQPENIYVCQYDNRKKSEHELEFNVGDLIYIVNTNGKNYNVGYKHDDRLRKMGLVYKGYIQPAYRKG